MSLIPYPAVIGPPTHGVENAETQLCLFSEISLVILVCEETHVDTALLMFINIIIHI